MGIQEVLVLVLFILAAAYIGRLIYRSLHAKSGCASGCGKCGADFSGVKLKD
ncbi:FeoB-associated Cys-rich membrane protein [Arcticibacter eurypsychrophilus]|uniref:FeoB-associated Cys-rich membrane protein n=1 Tax=Arcticibacter eurypsychrophilus TaxID=1434752 RepID=UPI00103B6F80|nr:FeoB-associated Cys-rich membrane protein [Arcticibacter eurypsychrophilus]